MSLTLWVPFLLVCMANPVLSINLMDGKTKTGRTVQLETIVNCAPPEVFQLWTTEEGVKKFFAPDARIDPVEGGAYTILFAPKEDPEGLSHGTKGARILKMIPGKFLSFEWITFAADANLGKNAPPLAAPEIRNAVPLPTWVEMSLEPVKGDPDKTHVSFAHYGFGEGQLWKDSFEWFSRAWKGVLDELATYCKDRER